MKFPESRYFHHSGARIALLIFCILSLTTQPFAQKSRFRARLQAPTASVQPILLTGNPGCADLNASTDPAFAHIMSDNEFKLDFEPPSGMSMYNFPSSDEKVTVTRTGSSFSFTSTRAVTAVIVKGGPDSNVYPYDPGTTGDTNLITPENGGFGISHISFCYGNPASVTIIKQVFTDAGGTRSTVQFPFTATANFGTTNFVLVDQDAVGPDRRINASIFAFGSANAIKVSEDASLMGWTLIDIDCTESGQQNTTVDLGDRSANIVVEDGEQVTCVFKNSDLRPSAADSSLSGRVSTWDGRGVPRANITVTNAFTGETRGAITNPFGYFTVDGLESGFFYFVRVSAKRMKFAESIKTVTLNDSLADMEFVANP